MNQTNAILGFFTETSLHAGTGQSLGVIDLPIQREAHTHWPCIYGSAVKGALRARAERNGLADIDLIFGPEPKPGEAADYAGALAVGDARLLLLPVRSLTSHFRWVTCPAVLKRFQRDAERLGLDAAIGPFKAPTVEGEKALVAEPIGDSLFLEEYRFHVEQMELNGIIAALAKLMPENLSEALKKQLTLVSDDLFRHLAEHATPVNAHVQLINETKTVKNGALWYEETLPPETLLYVCLNVHHARVLDSQLAADEILAAVKDTLFGQHPYLQLGGNETVGMGWCRVTVLTGGEG